MPEDSHKTLAFRSLCIQRFLGISSEDNLRYTDEYAFCDGINVIIGANATGKSTTAAALKAMLWPPRSGGELLAKDGSPLRGHEARLEHWRQHFAEMFAEESRADLSYITSAVPQRDVLSQFDAAPTRAEAPVPAE